MVIFQAIVYVLVGLSKFIGMITFGISLGWLILNSFMREEKPWQIQVTFLAGLFVLLVAMAIYVHVALGGFGLGFGLAIFLWGLPKKQKSEE